MNILVTGANGQLGNEMRVLSASHPAFTYFFTDVQELDITDINAVEQFVAQNNISAIVNCAAYTNVDKAEDDEPTAYLINADAAKNLAIIASKYACRLIHVSTDYVFNGEHFVPYKESEPTEPTGAYGRTKLAGENLIMSNCPSAIIIRTAWLYSSFGNNFVKTMLRLGREREQLGVVYDQIGSPTYAADLASAIFTVLESQNPPAGIYHFTNEGVCSWYDFTKEIHRQAAITTCNVNPLLSSEYPSKVKRPHYSVLDKQKIKQTFAITIPHWTEALQRCLTILEQ